MPSPMYNPYVTAGGFMQELFLHLPRLFNPDPKAADALTFLEPTYRYVSLENGVLYLHEQPLHTVGYTPEVSIDVKGSSLSALASTLTGSGYATSASVIGTPDGSTGALLLGFTDYTPTGSPVTLQIATATNWKVFYPIAQTMYLASQAADQTGNIIQMPFSFGFWLDFIGDWLNIPRLPGQNDSSYITYLLRSLRLPKVNNVALEDILNVKYGVPISVKDSGLKQFTVNMDASNINTPVSDIATVVNKAKAAGVSWILQYSYSQSESYPAYYLARKGTPISSSDSLATSLALSEPTYSSNRWWGFMASQGIVNKDATNSNTRVHEVRAVMYFNSPTDPSYTVL